MNEATLDSVERRHRARLRLLQMHYEAGVGHIGGNLSALDILLSLYHDVMGQDDQFILSKGHAAGALYIALWSLGRLSDHDLQTFHKDRTLLAGHPPARGLEDVLFATGSLGHGLSLAAGLALAKQLRGEPGRVFCLMSDGEWNEGSNWEALLFARHQGLSNLTFIVDQNGLQGFGTTHEVADLHPLADKFRAFRVPTVEIDGHDHDALQCTLSLQHGLPNAIVAETQKGRGVSYMEDRMEWHYLPMTAQLYEQARAEGEQTCATSFASHS